tara:strand:- start:49 stop:693 length:645 start_codon:yes stop_codon:yes gene_type:complete
MDEEITIIDTKTRNEKIKNFILKNKNKILSIIFIILVLILSFYSFKIYKENLKEDLSDKYNSAIIDFENGDKSKIKELMIEVIKAKDNTYSPLSLYFLIDNELEVDKNVINELFDILIKKTALEPEIKNLVIYKKGLYNVDTVNENELLDILRPLINSESIWKTHALYLVAEYFYSKNEMQKSKEFFNQIIIEKNANKEIIQATQKRLNRDFGD